MVSGVSIATCLARSVGLTLLVAVYVATPSAGQTVRGVVLESGSNNPIEDVRLILRDTEGNVRAVAVSEDNGRFELVADSAGLVQLEVSHLGYASWGTASFALGTDATLDVEVRLGVEAIPLDPITVVAMNSGMGRLADFRRRMNDPGRAGYFITESEIERRPMSTPSNLVLGVPGVSVSSVGGAFGLDRSVIVAGGCVARTFIDGVRVQQSAQHSIDDLLSPDLIAGVEVYSSSLFAPVQYQDAGGTQCGVVLFWTKEPEVGGESGWSKSRIGVGLGLLFGILTLGIVG